MLTGRRFTVTHGYWGRCEVRVRLGDIRGQCSLFIEVTPKYRKGVYGVDKIDYGTYSDGLSALKVLTVQGVYELLDTIETRTYTEWKMEL